MEEREPKVTRGIVAMLDALGVRNASIEETRKFISSIPRMREYTELVNTALIGSHPQLRDLWKEENFSIHNFGDTFLLVWKLTNPSDELLGLVTIGRVLSMVIFNGLYGRIRLRGAVSIGDIILDERSVLGPAINDVASWYDKAEFIGAVATPECGQHLSYIELKPVAAGFNDEKTGKRELDASFQKYDVPVKGGSTRNLWVVNWPDIATCRQQDPLGWYFERTRKLAIPFGTEQKYENTEKFIVEMLKRKEVNKAEDGNLSKPSSTV
jgi:hypothetical protein